MKEVTFNEKSVGGGGRLEEIWVLVIEFEKVIGIERGLCLFGGI